MKKYIKCVKLERGAGRMNGSTVFVEVPPTPKSSPLFRRVVPVEGLAAVNLSTKVTDVWRKSSQEQLQPNLSARRKASVSQQKVLEVNQPKGAPSPKRSSLQDILTARRQYLRSLVSHDKLTVKAAVSRPKPEQPSQPADVPGNTIQRITRSVIKKLLERSSGGRPTTVSILGPTRSTTTATITRQRCSRPSDKPYGEPLLQRIPLLAVSGSSVTGTGASSTAAAQSRRPIMLSVTGKHTMPSPVTICQRKRPFVNINGVANSMGGIGLGSGSGLVAAATGLPADAVGSTAAAAVTAAQTLSRKDRIPRPPNAFMLFANEYRKKLSSENPRESNKDISVRLGSMWKVMPKEKKDRYFDLARRVDEEHKRKYPHYVYNPKEARLRKAMRDQIRFRTQSSRAAVASGCAGGGGGGNGGGSVGGGRPGGGGGGSGAQPTAPPPPPPQAQQKSIASPQLQSTKIKKGFDSARQEEINFGVAHRLAEQQQSLQTQQAIRDQVESGLLNSYDEAFVELGTTNTNGYQSVGDLTAWYPLQMQAHDNGLRGWQVPTPGQGQFGSDEGSCITPSPQVSPYGQRLPHMISDAAHQQQQQQQQQQLLQKPKSEPYVNLYPGSSGEYPDHIKENNMLPEDRTEAQDGALAPTNGPTLESGPPLENGPDVENGTPTKLPGFQQAFGSTEIGRFSHEGFFSSQALELQVQTTPHGLPHSLHPNPSRRGISCPIPSAIPASSAPSTCGVNFSEGQNPKMFGARDGLIGSPEWPPLLFLAAGPDGPGEYPLHHHPSMLGGHFPDRHPAPPPPSMFSGGFGSPTFSPYGYYDYNLLNPVELMPFSRGQASSGTSESNPSGSSSSSGCGTSSGIASGTTSGCGPGSTPTHYTDLTELQPATPADYVLYPERATDLTRLQPPQLPKQLQVQDSSRTRAGSVTHLGNSPRRDDRRGSPVNVKMEHSADDSNSDQNGGAGDPDQAILRRMVLAEPIIISENERICVVLESNNAIGGSSDQFTNL